MSRLTDAALRFRAQLLRQERAAASEMVRAYAAAWRRLRAELAELEAQIAGAQAAGLTVGPFTPRQPGGPVIAQAPDTFSVSWVYRRERLLTLLAQVERELRQFNALAAEVTEAGQLQAVRAAQANAQALMAEAARVGGAPELVGMFNRLPTSAVEELVGLASDGSPLRELFEALGERTGRGVREALETAVATGMGPRETARLIRQQFGMGLNRALTIARTEQIRAYREASGRSYEANADVLDGWVWLSAADGRTCASCLAMHGSVHAVNERIDSHPNCRCVMTPRVKGAPIEVTPGEALFAQMTPAQQDAKLGKAAGAAYRAGAVKLVDFVGVRRDPDWGDSRYVKSLRSVVGDSEAKRWMRVTQQRQRSVDAQQFVRKELAALDVNRQMVQFLAERDLPKLDYHFDQHGVDMGCGDVEEYRLRFEAAMRRRYDEVFVSRQSGSRPVLMWRVVDLASGEVIQFNQKTGKVQSFYWVEDWKKFLANARPVRVRLIDGVWKVE